MIECYTSVHSGHTLASLLISCPSQVWDGWPTSRFIYSTFYQLLFTNARLSSVTLLTVILENAIPLQLSACLPACNPILFKFDWSIEHGPEIDTSKLPVPKIIFLPTGSDYFCRIDSFIMKQIMSALFEHGFQNPNTALLLATQHKGLILKWPYFVRKSFLNLYLSFLITTLLPPQIS